MVVRSWKKDEVVLWESDTTKGAEKANINGAIIGAGTAFVVNIVPGQGQAACGTAIAGVAAIGSASKGLEILLDWIWK